MSFILWQKKMGSCVHAILESKNTKKIVMNSKHPQTRRPYFFSKCVRSLFHKKYAGGALWECLPFEKKKKKNEGPTWVPILKKCYYSMWAINISCYEELSMLSQLIFLKYAMLWPLTMYYWIGQVAAHKRNVVILSRSCRSCVGLKRYNTVSSY